MFRRIVSLSVVWLAVCGVLPAADPPGVWLDVPFIRQEKNGCGAASIAMVMQYWEHQQGEAGKAGKTAADDPGEIQHALYSPSAEGIYASSMEKYFQQHGFRTFTFAG